MWGGVDVLACEVIFRGFGAPWMWSGDLEFEFKEKLKMPAKVNEESCTGCEACVGACPTEAIVMKEGKAFVTDECIDCGACVDECPVEAITME